MTVRKREEMLRGATAALLWAAIGVAAVLVAALFGGSGNSGDGRPNYTGMDEYAELRK